MDTYTHSCITNSTLNKSTQKLSVLVTVALTRLFCTAK